MVGFSTYYVNISSNYLTQVARQADVFTYGHFGKLGSCPVGNLTITALKSAFCSFPAFTVATFDRTSPWYTIFWHPLAHRSHVRLQNRQELTYWARGYLLAFESLRNRACPPIKVVNVEMKLFSLASLD